MEKQVETTTLFQGTSKESGIRRGVSPANPNIIYKNLQTFFGNLRLRSPQQDEALLGGVKAQTGIGPSPP